ncbi:MAG: insulinase family protein [Polyangiaceae bacterium]|nr:insulinase family protein [Polyangiaceae bacterium]
MRLALALVFTAIAVLAPLSLARAQATATTARAPAVHVPFEKYRLPNGLEVILHQDHSLPLVAINVWYHVGPVNEPVGRSGFAHLFEHLMFEGSRHVGKRFDTLLEAAGATTSNGSTSWDRTNYFETVPRQYLELVLWLESDRMGFMVDSLTAESLSVQRDVVLNERRQSYENAPYGTSSLMLLDSLFPPGHPYHGAIIGSVEDIRAATLTEVRQFFRDYYAPSNATLALAGDFERERAKALVDRYFGDLRRQPQPPRLVRTGREVPPKAGRFEVVEPVDLAQVSFGWVAPPAYSHQSVALEVAMALLAGGKATRLYRELVVDEQLASDVSAWVDPNALGSIVSVSALAASGKSVPKLERALEEAVRRLATEKPSLEEMQRAKRRLLVDLYDELQLLNGHGGESGRAGLLQRFNYYVGDPGALSDWAERIERVSAEDVRSVVAAELGQARRVAVITMPAARPESPP